MKIKSVALLGAGAVGAYIIWGLSEVKDIEFGIVCSVMISMYNETLKCILPYKDYNSNHKYYKMIKNRDS